MLCSTLVAVAGILYLKSFTLIFVGMEKTYEVENPTAEAFRIA